MEEQQRNAERKNESNIRLAADVCALDTALGVFEKPQHYWSIHCALFDLAARARMRECRGAVGRTHEKAIRAIGFVQQDLWSLATLIARLEWTQRETISGKLDRSLWWSYGALDVELFFIKLRSAMDHACAVLDDFAPKPGQIGKPSFRKLKHIASERSRKLPPGAVALVLATDWFDIVREVRDALVHNGGRSVLFCEPADCVAVFQVYRGTVRALIDHPQLMFNEHIVRFDRFAAWAMAHFLAFFERLGALVAPELSGDPRSGVTHSSGPGFDTLRSWMISLRTVVDQKPE